MVQIGSGAARKTPNVHLTRFAAYFVALNADQSKPEVRTLARLVRHYGPYAPEFSDTAQERARSRPREGPRRCGRRPEAVREKARGGAGGAPPLGRGTGIGWGQAGGTAGTRRGNGRDTPGERWGNARDTSETAPQHARRCEVRHIRLPRFDQSRPPVLRAVHTRQHSRDDHGAAPHLSPPAQTRRRNPSPPQNPQSIHHGMCITSRPFTTTCGHRAETPPPVVLKVSPGKPQGNPKSPQAWAEQKTGPPHHTRRSGTLRPVTTTQRLRVTQLNQLRPRYTTR